MNAFVRVGTRRRQLLIAAAFLGSVLTTGVLLASNMAHLATVQLLAAQLEVSNSGTNTINLPYILGASVVTANDLIHDIGFANVQNVQRFIRSTDAIQVYIGRGGSPGTNFALVAEECYFVKMSTSVNYVPSRY